MYSKFLKNKPSRVESLVLAFEYLDGRVGNNRNEEPVLIPVLRRTIRILQNFERVASQAWPHWRNRKEVVGAWIQHYMRL